MTVLSSEAKINVQLLTMHVPSSLNTATMMGQCVAFQAWSAVAERKMKLICESTEKII